MAWSYLGLFSKFYTQNEKFELRTQVINAKYRHGTSICYTLAAYYMFLVPLQLRMKPGVMKSWVA